VTGKHGFVARSIPTVTPKYCTVKATDVLRGAEKTKKNFPLIIPLTFYSALRFSPAPFSA
jgi:hypothetical protein